VAASVVTGQIISKVQPSYPLSARSAHIAGPVHLRAKIGRDGSIRELRLIDAPAVSLAVESLRAVRQWKYKPYMLKGLPAEVDTTITVNFTIGL